MKFLEWARANHDLFSIVMIVCLLMSFRIFWRHRRAGRLVTGDRGYFWRLCRAGDRDGIIIVVSSILTIATALLKML